MISNHIPDLEYINQNEKLISIIKAEWDKHRIGCIYLDIVKFSHIEKKYGQEICNKIIITLERKINQLCKDYSNVLLLERIGDDFFIYIKLKKDMLDEEQQLKIQALSIGDQIRSQLNKALDDVEEGIDLHIGYTLLYRNANQSDESIVYSAIKNIVKNSKYISNDFHIKEEFEKILLQKQLSTYFQPIVSLSQGNIFGYEALSRGPISSSFFSPTNLFAFAESEGYLYPLEKMCRETAIHHASQFLRENQKIFININSQVIHDPNFTTGYTSQLLKKYKLKPSNIVFEITERSPIQDYDAVKKVLQHYRSQGFQIAIDDAGTGYSSLQAISELKPDFIKVDRSLIEGIDQNKVKEILLETFINISLKMNSKVIAEGIESERELAKLTRMGVHYGQGYILAKPTFPPQTVLESSIKIIKKNKRISYNELSSKMHINEIITPVATFSADTKVSIVSKYFKLNPEELGVVIVNEGYPIGLVMKEKLYQELVKPFRMSLYWDKNINLLMDPNPLIVEKNTPIDLAAQMAISREQKTKYDFVVIIEDAKLQGIVSIDLVLDYLANIKMEMVRQSNPLTGLPGNAAIQKEIGYRLNENIPFSLIYVDIDHFKWFNDRFGFSKGDEIIKVLADMLHEIISDLGSPGDFLGHIGGDDFVIVTLDQTPQQICHKLMEFFKQYYLEQQVTFSSSSPHELEDLSISIALITCTTHLTCQFSIEELSNITAEIKKKAKNISGNSMYQYTC